MKNSGAVAIGAVITAALGFMYWWLAARSFPPEVIGKTSALLSLMGLVGLLGEGGFGTLLTGEIICHPGRERGLIGAAALVTLAMSLAAGGLLLLLSGPASRTLGGVGSSRLSELWFIIGCALTGLSLVIDQAFVGMLQSNLRMLRQFLFSACKLALIAVVASWSGDEATILFSWVASQMVSLVVVEVLARKRGGSLFQRPDFSLLRGLKGKVVSHYMLDVSIQAPSIILPYLVTVLLSPASNAAFSAIWMVLLVGSVIPAALATVLFPVIRAEPDQYREKMLLSLGASLAFAIAFSSFLFTYSTEILSLFNPAYAEIGGSNLRFLGFGVIGAVVKFHICAGARLTNSMRKASIWFCLGGLAELVAATVGCRLGGLEGLSIGWAAALLIEGVVMLLIAVCVTQWTSALPLGTRLKDADQPASELLKNQPR
ncbi:MAG: oligosaccharide flippase family protein [Methylovirgula sp.]